LARVLLSYIRPGKFYSLFKLIYNLTDPLINFCQRIIPGSIMGLDFSPILAWFLLTLTENLLLRLLQVVFH